MLPDQFLKINLKFFINSYNVCKGISKINFGGNIIDSERSAKVYLFGDKISSAVSSKQLFF